MHEYEILEKKWKRYRLKKLLKILIPIIAIAAGLFFYMTKQKHPQIQNRSVATNEITPSLAFEKKIERYLHMPQPKKEKKKKKSTTKPVAPPPPQEEPKKVIISSQTQDIAALKRRYLSSPSLELALLIAKNYYDQGRYDQALKWSMKANELDRRNEQSWILFAKSAYKKGDKKRAIEALSLYVKKTGSKKAKELLQALYKGIVP